MKYYVFLLVAMLILLGACEVEKPVVPKWDIDLAVPLINEMYYVSDLVDDENIFVDGNDVLFLSSSGDVTTPEFGEVEFTPPDDAQVIDKQIYHVDNIPTQSMPFEDPTGKVQFSYASLTGGQLKTRFVSTVAGSYAKLEFQDLYDANNNKLVITANSSSWVSTPLAGCHFGVDGASTLITELKFTITSVSDAAEFTPTGRLSLDATSEMAFDALQGRLTDFTLLLDDNLESIDLEYPEDLNESVTLQSATINLELENRLGFEAEFTGELYATNDEGEERVVPIKDDDNNNFHASPGHNSFHVTQGMSELLSIMPTSIKVRNGSFRIYTGATPGSVHATDFINMSYVVKAPFTFTLHPNEIVIQNEVDIPIAQENADRIEKNALGASLDLKVLNKVPVGATATAYFSDTPNIDVANPLTYDFSIPPVTIVSSSAPGGAVDQLVTVTLSESQIKLFASPHVYLRWKFSFIESSEFVTIHASTADFIQIKGMLNAKIAVEDL